MRFAVVLSALLLCLPLSARPDGAESPTETGPDTVSIAGSSYWFAPAEFPHADHVDFADSCADCHHHGDDPTDINSCDTCHQELFDPDDPEVPPLRMAYHQRCIGCHRSEDAGPSACVDCHERKALPAGPPLGEGRVPK